MKDGFIKIAAATPEIRVADCGYNAKSVIEAIKRAARADVRLLALPELCLTGYTCGDLFLQRTLLDGALDALECVTRATEGLDMLVVCGVPIARGNQLYNCAAVLYNGKVLGFVPKTHIPNYAEFYEQRYFAAAPATCGSFRGAAFGTKLLFACEELTEFTIAVEICEDLWAACPPSTQHAAAGATVIVNLSASDEIAGKAEYRRRLVCGQSARQICGYLYADAGEGESTTDLVFAGHNIITENGVLLAESKPFSSGLAVSELDLQLLSDERRRTTTFPRDADSDYLRVPFSMPLRETALTRAVSPMPFIPCGAGADEELSDILNIQAHGLKRRLLHSRAKTAVLGISGGLDSTLALLVTVRAMGLLARPLTDILAVTMPCFGTTARTKGNAELLCERLGVQLRQVDIAASVRQHFEDIGQSEDSHDVTFENAQARERTQVLMDLANLTNGLVVGTGDLSELALGWATYNGDHMSMYGVNASVPKTLIRALVAFEAARTDDSSLKETLLDILDTPVSPELLPSKEGEIEQKTEDLVGPYELHDFFLYQIIRWGMPPAKTLRLAEKAFAGQYDRETMLHWLKIFCRRFFTQQFKRSCLPDGPKTGAVSLSPRGDWRMPSDAAATLWLDQLERL